MELLVDGVDLTGFELVYATMTEPLPKTYAVDIPGGSTIDLSDFGGDVAYQNRTLDALLICDRESHADVVAEVARLANLLDGRRLRFTLSERPGLTWTGRFSFGTTDQECYRLRAFHLSADVSPYGDGGTTVIRANAAGGIRVVLVGGRARVRPTIECYRTTLVSCDGRDWTLEPGTWQLEDMWLHSGDNVVAIDTTPEYDHGVLSDYAGDLLSAHAKEMLTVMAAGGVPLQSSLTLSEIAGNQLWDYEATRLIDMCHPEDTSDETYNVYFAYEKKEL